MERFPNSKTFFVLTFIQTALCREWVNVEQLEDVQGLLMFLVVIIILIRFMLWSYLSAYLDYKLSQRFPDKMEKE
ncbi:small integral membrane protein 38 [Carettochelys insculpta]|uniref:small integral membrane protein 38 n=1 Tax=Carettochelys insculpta TaxID=44489 RepID=UPI003EBC12E5